MTEAIVFDFVFNKRCSTTLPARTDVIGCLLPRRTLGNRDVQNCFRFFPPSSVGGADMEQKQSR